MSQYQGVHGVIARPSVHQPFDVITAEETEVYQINAKNTKNIIATRRNDKLQIVNSHSNK